MKIRLLSALLVAGLALIASAGGVGATESNYWPFWVERTDALTGLTTTSALGPLYFTQSTPDGLEISGFRPFWDDVCRMEGDSQLAGSFGYPLAHWESDPATGYDKWTIFNLINFDQLSPEGPSGFDIWPFYFSRDSGDEATSYRALFPLYGDITHRFSQDRFNWVLFPLYGRFQKGDAVTTTTPWPFIKTVTGEGHRGFELWPLGGYREETGVTTDAFALWPLLYRQQTHLDAPLSSLKAGFLPFYALDRQPGYRSETYLWPFFGYVDRTAPYRYHARHYLWPLWVQGHGDDRSINRWAPFYSHSRIKGHDKTWVLWPLWRQATWTDATLQHERRQFLYFLYHETTQRDRVNPDLAPARKTHVWPLFSSWDNGAGQKQWQTLSPIEVFLPHQERTRRLWSPLFALYRFNQTAPGETRRSLLWDAVTYARSEELDTREFHLGPLLGFSSHADGERIGFLTGLFGFQRAPTQKVWRPFIGRQQPASLSLTP
jgi:hypothetical protein